MKYSENLYTFDETRNEFKPYGLTCELWTPSLMGRPDRHNEIEINYFPEGNMTYLFQKERRTIPAKRLALFWGLMPHQIVHYEGSAPYYVCTIPFSLFLDWKLPSSFVSRILKGEVVLDDSEKNAMYDDFLLRKWIEDIDRANLEEVILLEMRARLSRLAYNSSPEKKSDQPSIDSNEINHVERIAIYIGQNYRDTIEASDIGEAVGLHPDYANSIFKKAFGSTLSEYIIEERISHAQRKLITTDKNIASVAFECGFNSISWFNACFKQMNGCTPREFRNRNRSAT